MRARYGDDSARWRAVQRRDPTADGQFLYAVKTTKIYCRPICRARLARRANVGFFSSASDAEAAGYRACKRCKPAEGSRMPEAAAVARIRSYLEREPPVQASLRTEPKIDELDVGNPALTVQTTAGLAKRAQVSKWHFHRIFKELTGLTPYEYAQNQRATARRLPMDIPTPSQASLTDGDDISESNGSSSNDAAASDHWFMPMTNDMVDWAMLSSIPPFDYPWNGNGDGLLDDLFDGL